MEMPEEVWVVAGECPGAKRFGHLVQSLRRERGLSVEEVAEEVALSAGSVRAIEQGRRAPSRQSGLKLLQLLLPPQSRLILPAADSEGGASFQDPSTNRTVGVIFGAKKQGDKRRWSSDAGAVPTTAIEEGLTHALQGLDTQAAALSLGEAFQALAPKLEGIRDRATQPPSDVSLGRTVRRVSQLNALRMMQLRGLSRMWLEVDSGKASDSVREVVELVDEALGRVTYLDEEGF